MIGKVVRGNDVGGLLRYLYGSGRANEHTNPHVVAAWDDEVVADHPPRAEPRLKRLTALLEQPLAALDRRPSPSVWHCPLRTAPGDRTLSDAEWADVAAEVLHQTGLAPRGDAGGCRWVAVRHADNHIHLAVTLARQDGQRARTPHDYAKLGAACRTVELRYGLTVTPSRNRTAPKRPTRAELEKASRKGELETPRQRLRREVLRAALAASDLSSFVSWLRAAGVHVRLRYSHVYPGVVSGYSVALETDGMAGRDLVWFGGGKLAPQLTLPRIIGLWQGSLPAGQVPNACRRGPTHASAAEMLRDTSNVIAHLERGKASAAAATAISAVVRDRSRRDGR